MQQTRRISQVKGPHQLLTLESWILEYPTPMGQVSRTIEMNLSGHETEGALFVVAHPLYFWYSALVRYYNLGGRHASNGAGVSSKEVVC